MSNGAILRFVDSIAFEQGPYTPSPSFTDITAFVRPGSNCSFGRQNRNGAFEATTTSLKVDNKSGNFTPFNPVSIYGDMDDALPYKREVEYPIGSGNMFPYWAGVVSDVNAGFEGAARGVASIALQQRLALPGLQPLDSIVQGQISRSNPVNFWAFDDGADPLFLEDAKDFRGDPFPRLKITNKGTLGSITFGVGDSPGPDEGGSRVAFDPWDNYDGFLLENDNSAAESFGIFQNHESYIVLNTTGPVQSNVSVVYEFRDIYGSGVKLELDGTGHPSAIVRDGFSGDLAKVTSSDILEPGVDYAVGMTVTNENDVSTLTLWVDGESHGSDTFAWTSGNVWSVSSVVVGGSISRSLFYSGTVANLAKWDAVTAGDSARRDFYTASLFGYDSDTADVRVARILDLAGIPAEYFTTRGTFTRTIATQPTQGRTFIELLKEIETAEIGRIFCDASGDLGLASSSAYYFPEQSVRLSADTDFDLSGTFGVDPDNAVNSWRGQRSGGSDTIRFNASQSIIDKRGQKSRDDGSEIPLNNDDDVAQIGHWLVNTTALPSLRFPQVTVSIARVQRDEQKVQQMLKLAEGDQVVLMDLPIGAPVSEYVGFVERVQKVENGDDIKVTMILSQWIEIQTFSPLLTGQPYNAPIVYTAAVPYSAAGSRSYLFGESDRYSADEGSITTSSALTDSETSVTIVTADGSPLITSDPADLPLDLNIGGERVTCTAVSGSTSPQTLTISRGNAPTTPVAHASGVDVSIWPTAVYGV